MATQPFKLLTAGNMTKVGFPAFCDHCRSTTVERPARLCMSCVNAVANSREASAENVTKLFLVVLGLFGLAAAGIALAVIVVEVFA